MANRKPQIIDLYDSTDYLPKDVLTPAELFVFLGESYHEQPEAQRLVHEDKRNWLVPVSLLEKKKSIQEVLEERRKIPLITGGYVLDTFRNANNSLEGTIKIPDFMKEDILGFRLYAPEIPAQGENMLLTTDHMMIREMPKVVILKASGEEVDSVRQGEHEIRLSAAFHTFAHVMLPIDPYAEDFLDPETRPGDPEGQILKGTHGKEQ